MVDKDQVLGSVNHDFFSNRNLSTLNVRSPVFPIFQGCNKNSSSGSGCSNIIHKT